MKNFLHILQQKIKVILEVIKSFFMRFLSSIKALKDYIFSNKIRTAIFYLSFVVIGAIGLGSYYFLRTHYSIHSSITSGFYMVPKDAEFYFEIKSTTLLKDSVSNTKLIKSIESSEAWTKFLSTIANKRFGDLLYIVELKSNYLLSWKDFIDLFSENIGYISFKDNSYSIVAKTNLKSKLGITLLDSFKAEKIQLKKNENKPTETKQENTGEYPTYGNDGANVISNETYESEFLEEKIKKGNLNISQIKGNSGELYFVMVGDFLILSNSIDNLVKTLEASTNPKKNSIISLKDIDLILKEYNKNDVLGILYLQLENTIFTPFLKPISENSNSISFLFKMDNNLLTADIVATEKKSSSDFKFVPIQSIQSSIPKDVSIAIYSNSLGWKEIFESILNPGEFWMDLQTFVPATLAKVNFSHKEYFSPNSTSIILIHKPIYHQTESLFYPEFTLGYASPKEDDQFLNLIFKKGTEQKESFLNSTYKTYKRENSFYSPSLFQSDKINWISSSSENAESCISAKSGNKSTIADFKSLRTPSQWLETPHHIVLNYSRFKEDLISFFIFGGIKSLKYSETTVTNDIQPLLESFDWIESIHIALGAKGDIYGKLFIAE